MRYHMGCGEQRLAGYVNVDLQETSATDLLMDLSASQLAELGPADVVFSNAFFEHLRRSTRVPHLRAVRKALTEEGFVCYLGFPDFVRVAQLYLDHGPGAVGPVFDLFNVYRYTHGDPEMASSDEGWEAQLHKSLFDVDDVGRLLRDAGYPSYVIFRYVFPDEPVALDLNLGFFATAFRRPRVELERACRDFLEEWDGRFLLLSTLRFEDGRSVPDALARVAGHPRKRLLQRVSYAIAARLARDTHPV